MNIVVLGSTGGIGRQVVAQALAAGHEVTAVVRKDPGFDAHPALHVVQADVTRSEDLEPLVTGADAVISALGRRKGDRGTIQGDAAEALTDAAPAAMRAVFVGASAMHSDGGDGPFIRWLAKPLLRWILRASYADTARMESLAEHSDLRWTVVRPSRLTDGPHTGRYRSSIGRNLRGGAKISRADVADALLATLTDVSALRTAVYVAY